MNVNLKDLNHIYLEVKKNTKNKRKIYHFEKNKIQKLSEIKESISTYNGGSYNIFIITKPKIRVIMSQNIKDKVINHYVSRFILEPKLEKYLDDRNIATRKNKGTSLGIKILKKYIEKNKKYKNFYILKIDISKYFYNIDHKVLKDMLIDKLDKEEYFIIEKIIDSTNQDYINKTILKLSKKYNLDLSIYSYGKGLPIGNLSSQILSIFY